MAKDADISTKGLDEFAIKFLSGKKSLNPDDPVVVTKGQKLSDAAVRQYEEHKKSDFIQRAGKFTEDLIGFIIEQKQMRNLSDPETIFGLALMSINMRNAYGSTQKGEKPLTAEEKQAMLDMFDDICWGAQQYWDANQ